MDLKRDRLTTQEVCDKTGLPKTKIKYWVQATGLNIPKDGSGAWRWTPELVEQLELIKTLREMEGRTMDTVRRVIGQSTDSEGANQEEPAASAQPVGGEHLDSVAIASAVSSSIVPQLVDAINAQNELAQSYAVAARQIGRLESEVEHLRAQLTEAREKIGLLEAPKPQRPWWKLW